MSNLTTWKSSLKEAHAKFVAINPEKANIELGFAMQIIHNSDSLQKCDPQSIINAIVNVARTSVTLNPVMRLAYLVPRKGKCVLDFSYMGLVAMLRDNNCIKSISAHIVYEDEDFIYDASLNLINHRPKYAKTELEHKKRVRIGCYSRATLPNGESVYEFMPMWEIEKVKSLSEGSNSKYSAWQTWEDEMIKKVVIKRHFKMLISLNHSEQLSTALQVENESNGLIGGIGVPNANSTSKKKPSLMSAFDEEEEDPNQLSLMEEEPIIVEEPAKKPIDTSMDFSEEEIELMLEEESRKALKNYTEPSIESMDLFPSNDEEDMDWFPTAKD
jgi:recombination protein RecT